MSMFTDPTRIHANDPGHIEGNPVFTYLDTFDPNTGEVEELKARYRLGKVGDVQVKARLAEVLNEYLAPLRQKRVEYASRQDDLIAILDEGTQAATPIAMATLQEVESKMGLSVLNSSRSANRQTLSSRR